ncbi:MAG: hypothetical protein D3908_14440, partial [Candidatus Electrothrix sp. AUS4]|nr:hypothetical protein [Candidatus Electrothrix sp. AUS4]
MIARSLRPLFLLVLCACFLLTVPAKARQIQPVTLTLPIATLHQALRTLLPLPIEQHKKNRNFRGTFVVESIDRLTVRQDNVLALQGQLSG